MKEIGELRYTESQDSIETAMEIKALNTNEEKRDAMADFYAKISTQHPPLTKQFFGSELWQTNTETVKKIIKEDGYKKGTHSEDIPFQLVKEHRATFARI